MPTAALWWAQPTLLALGEPASPRGQGAVFGVEDEEGGQALALGFAAFFEAEHVQAAALGFLGGLAVGSLLRGFFSPDAG